MRIVFTSTYKYCARNHYHQQFSNVCRFVDHSSRFLLFLSRDNKLIFNCYWLLWKQAEYQYTLEKSSLVTFIMTIKNRNRKNYHKWSQKFCFQHLLCPLPPSLTSLQGNCIKLRMLLK